MPSALHRDLTAFDIRCFHGVGFGASWFGTPHPICEDIVDSPCHIDNEHPVPDNIRCNGEVAESG